MRRNTPIVGPVQPLDSAGASVASRALRFFFRYGDDGIRVLAVYLNTVPRDAAQVVIQRVGFDTLHHTDPPFVPDVLAGNVRVKDHPVARSVLRY